MAVASSRVLIDGRLSIASSALDGVVLMARVVFMVASLWRLAILAREAESFRCHHTTPPWVKYGSIIVLYIHMIALGDRPQVLPIPDHPESNCGFADSVFEVGLPCELLV